MSARGQWRPHQEALLCSTCLQRKHHCYMVLGFGFVGLSQQCLQFFQSGCVVSHGTSGISKCKPQARVERRSVNGLNRGASER